MLSCRQTQQQATEDGRGLGCKSLGIRMRTRVGAETQFPQTIVKTTQIGWCAVTQPNWKRYNKRYEVLLLLHPNNTLDQLNSETPQKPSSTSVKWKSDYGPTILDGQRPLEMLLHAILWLIASGCYISWHPRMQSSSILLHTIPTVPTPSVQQASPASSQVTPSKTCPPRLVSSPPSAYSAQPALLGKEPSPMH